MKNNNKNFFSEHNTNKKEQLTVVIVGLFIICILIFFYIYNLDEIINSNKNKIPIFIGGIFILIITLFSYIFKALDKKELIEAYNKVLSLHYENNFSIKGVHYTKIVAGDKSKTGAIRKKINIEMFIKQYNCSILCYKLQKSIKKYQHYPSWDNNSEVHYEYSDIANMIIINFPYLLIVSII